MTRRTPLAALTSASPRRRQRALATAAGGVAVIALAGCQWTSTIQTDKPYEAADGTSVRIGEVQLSNMLVVAEKKGAAGTLVGRGVNYAQQPVELTFSIGQGAPTKVSIPAGGTLQFSDTAGKKTTLPAVPAAPGGLIDMHVTSAGGGDRDLRVPVLAPHPPYEKFGTKTGGATPTGSSTGTGTHGATPTSTVTTPAQGDATDQAVPAPAETTGH